MRYLINNLILVSLFSTTALRGQQTIIFQPSSVDGKDAFVFDYYPTSNYGSDDRLDITAWTESGTPYISRALIEFDLSSIPSNASVNSALLSLYHNNTTTFYNGIHSGANMSLVQRIMDPWTESTVNWINQPAVSNVGQVVLPQSISGTQNYSDIDVSVMVADMVNNPATNFGFMIALIDETPYKDILFASSDHANWNRRPKLEVNYTLITDLKEKVNSPQLKLLPNPLSDQSILSVSESFKLNTISIINMQGSLVFTAVKEYDSRIVLNRKEFIPGFYLLNAYSEDGLMQSLVFLVTD